MIPLNFGVQSYEKIANGSFPQPVKKQALKQLEQYNSQVFASAILANSNNLDGNSNQMIPPGNPSNIYSQIMSSDRKDLKSRQLNNQHNNAYIPNLNQSIQLNKLIAMNHLNRQKDFEAQSKLALRRVANRKAAKQSRERKKAAIIDIEMANKILRRYRDILESQPGILMCIKSNGDISYISEKSWLQLRTSLNIVRENKPNRIQTLFSSESSDHVLKLMGNPNSEEYHNHVVKSKDIRVSFSVDLSDSSDSSGSSITSTQSISDEGLISFPKEAFIRLSEVAGSAYYQSFQSINNNFPSMGDGNDTDGVSCQSSKRSRPLYASDSNTNLSAFNSNYSTNSNDCFGSDTFLDLESVDFKSEQDNKQDSEFVCVLHINESNENMNFL